VLVARSRWSLPYHRARMELLLDDGVVQYRSDRRWPAPRPARFAARYRVGRALGVAAPGTLDHFLVERYALFARDRRGAYPVRT